jgi:2-polyprenyl-6-methoxyphenol hydroxylase-like FAD-dependent oxidoreductase
LTPSTFPRPPSPHLLLIRQADIEAVLTDALTTRGIRIERGTAAASVKIAAHSAAAYLSDDLHRSIECRYLVGCDVPDCVVRTAQCTPPGRVPPTGTKSYLPTSSSPETSNPVPRTPRPGERRRVPLRTG